MFALMEQCLSFCCFYIFLRPNCQRSVVSLEKYPVPLRRRSTWDRTQFQPASLEEYYGADISGLWGDLFDGSTTGISRKKIICGGYKVCKPFIL